MTRATLVLAAHSLKRMRVMLVCLGLLLAGFQFLLTQVADYLQSRSAFGSLSMLVPDFVRSVAGPSSLAFLSFSGIVGLGYFHPIVIAAVVGVTIAIATEPAAEVERRFVDLTLSRPIARAEVITRTLLVILSTALALVALMATGTLIGLACCTGDAERPSPALIASLAVNLVAVMLCWSGVALAAAAAVSRRAVAGGFAGVAALAAYLLDYLGRAWEPARAISKLSPFHYFEPTALIMGQPLSVRNVAVLGGIAAAGTVVSYVLFARRDI